MEICFGAMRVTNTPLIQGLRRLRPDFKYERHHINLRQLAGDMDRHEATPGSNPPWQVLEKSTVLGISFSALSRRQVLSQDEQRSFTRLITPMSQTLTILDLHASYRLGVLHNIIHDLSQNAHLPKLKNLTLYRGAVDYGHLIKLILRHSGSLKTTQLQFLALSYDSWSDVFLTLANARMP